MFLIDTEFIDIEKITDLHEGIFRLIDVMEDRKSADLAILIRDNDFLLRVLKDVVDIVLKLLIKSRFKHVRFSFNMKIIDLLTKHVDPLQFVFFSETDDHITTPAFL